MLSTSNCPTCGYLHQTGADVVVVVRTNVVGPRSGVSPGPYINVSVPKDTDKKVTYCATCYYGVTEEDLKELT